MPQGKKTYDCIIADDDEVDKLTVVSFVRRYPFLNISGVFDLGSDALEFCKQKQQDVLFLDIDMPGMNGMEIREQLIDIPACIFITSYPDFAVEGFELSALDFLVKPLKAERFDKAMHRLQDYMQVRQKAELLDYTLGADSLFIKDGHQRIKIHLHEVLYLEALKDYTAIVTASKKYCVLSSLGNLLKEKAFQAFIRIHRSYAVQKHFISTIAAHEILIQGISLPVGRSYKEALELLKT